MTDPLAFAAFELALGVSTAIGLTAAVFLLVGAARSRFGWTPAVITSVLAVALPFLGPALALWIFLNPNHVIRRKAPIT